MNGVVIELSEAELDRLDIREIRYDRVDVTGSVEGEGLPERIVTYTAKDFHFAPEPPEDSVILATYVAAVELGFTQLGAGSWTTTSRRPPIRSSASRPSSSSTRSRTGTRGLGDYARCQWRAQSRSSAITGSSEWPLSVSS